MIIYFESIILGSLVGIFSSAMFLLILSRYKPKLEISPYIAVKKKSNGSMSYIIKIVNRTPRDIINVRAELSVINFSSVHGGVIINTTPIRLKKSEVFQISKYDKRDINATYAYRFVCSEDLNSIWAENNGNYVRFKIIATDSFTGFSKVFTREFHVKRESFVAGSHSFGNTLNVV